MILTEAIIESIEKEITSIEHYAPCSRSPDYWQGEIKGLRKAIKIIKENDDGQRPENESVR